MKEIWKPVVGYEGIYEVSNLGRVKGLAKTVKTGEGHRATRYYEERIKDNINITAGYYGVTMSKNNKKKLLRVHRLVAEAFIDNPNNKPFVNHLDGNKKNNNLDNLEWCTHRENCIHAIENKLYESCKGEDRPESKLSNEKVRYIRRSLKEGTKTGVELASELGVYPQVISSVKLRRTWKHVK